MKYYSFAYRPRLWIVFAVAFLALPLTRALKHSYFTRHDERSLIGPLGFPFGFLDTGHYNLTVFDFKLVATNKPHEHDPHFRSSLAAKDDTTCDTCLQDVLNNVRGVGFLLKQFKDEASFNRYMNSIQEDRRSCIFQKYLDRDFDDDLNTNAEFDDDYAFHYDDFYDDIDDLFGGYDDFTAEYNDLVDDEAMEIDDYAGDDGSVRSRRKRRRKLEDGPQGFGEVIDTVEDGIYLDMLPRQHWKPASVSVAYDFEPGQAGLYFLIYQVCYKINPDGSDETDVYDIHSRFELDFHFSNRDMFNHISYLSRGEMNLPWLFFAFSLLYAVCLYIWYSNIKLINDGKPGFFDIGDAHATAPVIPGSANTPATPSIYPIHYLMGVLLALKFSTLLFDAIRYHYLRVKGHANFFSAVYYFFAFLKGFTLFTVILLIGSGWSFVKPFLTDREKKMILGVIVLQVINNIAIVVLTQETEGEISFDRWTALLHLVDIVCCCAVLLPIVWQVNQLEKNMEQNEHKGKEDNDSEEDSFINAGESQFVDEDSHIPENELDGLSNDGDESSVAVIPDARMLAKLKLFRSFYMLVIGYIYMTRIVVYLFSATLDYKHTWIPVFVVELTTILFYTAVGYMFRPMNENPYLHIANRKSGKKRQPQIEMRKIDPSTKTALD